MAKKILKRWVGVQKSYVIFRVGPGKCLRPITRWVGGVQKGQKHAYVIFERSPREGKILQKFKGSIQRKNQTIKISHHINVFKNLSDFENLNSLNGHDNITSLNDLNSLWPLRIENNMYFTYHVNSLASETSSTSKTSTASTTLTASMTSPASYPPTY